MRTSTLRAMVAGALIAGLLLAGAPGAEAATFTSTSMTMTDSRPSQSANYTFTISGQTTTQSLQCITIQFNTAADGTGAVPNGFSASAATWSGNFHASLASWTRAHTAGLAKITGSAQTPPAGTGRTITLTTVTNSSVADTNFYAILKTFSDNTCSTPVDNSTISFVFTTGSSMSMAIPPAMTFTVANKASACNGETGFVDNSGGLSTSLSLGSPAPGTSTSTAQTLTATSNAGGNFASGVTVYLRGLYPTGNLRSPGHEIQDAQGTPGGLGDALGAGERFGYTVVDGSGQYGHSPGDFVALDDIRRPVLWQDPPAGPSATGCVGYQVQTVLETSAGHYTATLIYSSVPDF